MNATLIVSQEHNGLELYFPEKPAQTVLDTLSAAKWRYHRVKKCWYARNNAVNQAIAAKFTGMNAPEEDITPESEAFFPPYDSVGGVPVYKSSNISRWDYSGNDGYFADIKAYISVRPNRVTIHDLSDALTPGKECERLVIEAEDDCSPTPVCAGLDTFRDVYDKFFVRREQPNIACHVYSSMRKAMRVFTPFKRFSPIKTPAKWTIPHIWKAILAGQIYQGNCDGRYTDDYAYDAAVHFREGVGIHLPSFAKQLIEDSSGWRVYPDKVKGDHAQLSVDCCSFDMNTLYFDQACDLKESEHRRNERESERQQHNADLESRLLSFDEVDAITTEGLLFDVKLLEMNDNTGRYEVKPKLMLRKNLLYNGQLNHDVIAVTPHVIANDGLFELSCSAALMEDERVMLTCDDYVVSGRALRELFSNPETAEQITNIKTHRETWAQLRDNLVSWCDGRVQSLFAPIPRERFIRSLARLDAERTRIDNCKGEIAHA